MTVVKATINFGWRVVVESITTGGSGTGLTNITCSFTNPAVTADGTIVCDATGAESTTDFIVATIRFKATSIGPAPVKFDTDTAKTFANRVTSPVLRRDTLPKNGSLVRVQGMVAVKFTVNLQAPAPNNNERFTITLYKKGAFGPAIADRPWLIFNATGDVVRTVILTADASAGGKGFTLLLTGDNKVRTGVYDITIVTKRGSGGLKDTLANLRDNVNIDRPPDDLEKPLITDMKTLLEGNAVNDTRLNVELSTIINALDASLLAAVIKAGSYDVRVDFTRDGGTVDDADFNLLQSNYLKFSPVILAPE